MANVCIGLSEATWYICTIFYYKARLNLCPPKKIKDAIQLKILKTKLPKSYIMKNTSHPLSNSKENGGYLILRKTRLRVMFKTFLTALALILSIADAFSQLNPNFGTNGLVTTNFFTVFGTGSSDIMYDMNVLSDGKVLCVGRSESPSGGSFSFAAARYLSDGTLDNTFGINNFNPPGTFFYSPGEDAEAFKMALQADGKIVMVGYIIDNSSTYVQQLAIMRLNANGTTDNTFGTNGITKLWGQFGIGGNSHNIIGRGIALYPDGKILVAAELSEWNDNKLILCRLNTDGTLDNTFGTNSHQSYSLRTGLNYEYIGELVYNPSEDAFYMCGHLQDQTTSNNSQAYIMKLNSDGSLVSSFGANGVLEFQLPTAGKNELKRMIIHNDELIACGNARPSGDEFDSFLAVNLGLDGTLDVTFNQLGYVSFLFPNHSAFAESVAIDNDGNIILAGGANNASFQQDIALVRMDGNGTVLNSLVQNLGSPFGEIAYAIAILPSNNVLASGRYDGAIPAERANFFLAEFDAALVGGSVPADPTNLVATVFKTQSNYVELTWTDNSNNETGFGIERSTNGTTFFPLDNVAANVTLYQDVNISPTTTYYYRVYAYNTSGNSGNSNVVEVTTDGSVGTKENASMNRFRLHPNPSNGTFTLQTEKGGVFDLMDLTGNVIASFTATSNTLLINENLPSGLYFVREKGKHFVQKLYIHH